MSNPEISTKNRKTFIYGELTKNVAGKLLKWKEILDAFVLDVYILGD